MRKKFGAAFAGIVYCFCTQINMVIHFLAALTVILAGLYFHIERWEWVALTLTITLVLVAEALNTALEVTLNAYTRASHPEVKVAKDVAAGAVLLATLGSVVVGYLIFGPRLRGMF